MAEYNRPNPEEFLKRIQDEENEEIVDKGVAGENKGRLKVFLGFCAGVGKTYHMLEETKVALKNGVNAIIGVVETHGRKETEALLEGLEILPRKKIDYNGLALDEMDLDKILELKPELVIVDELAHTNVPGSRHDKRYQDVEEILKAGINVYATLNIQHIESLIDIVHEVSAVSVQETVPDRILDIADEIELIDLTPEKLLERLQEGKVYIPEKAKQAMKKFFRKGNLLALRELSLRYTAKRVDEDVLSYKQRYSITTPWPVGSRLLVGFSSSPTSERLLRITHRMASDMGAEWFAVYVESTQQQVEISEKAKFQLDKNIRLAEELGAKVVSLSGNVIADAIINFAKEKNVTLIVAGLSYRSRLDEIFRGSVLSDLTKKSGQINVLIVGNENKNVLKHTPENGIFDFKPYLICFSVVAIIVFSGYHLHLGFEYVALNVAMFLFLPVIISSILWGTRVSLFTAVVSALLYDFVLIEPHLSFSESDLGYWPGLVVIVIVSLVVSTLAKGIRWQTESTRHRERFLTSLYWFSRELMKASNLDEALHKSAEHISDAFQCDVAIILPDESDELHICKKQGHTEFTDKQEAIASWAYKNGLPAGLGTQTLPSAIWHYQPLKTEDVVCGVLCIVPRRAGFLSSEQQRLLDSFANIIAMYLSKR